MKNKLIGLCLVIVIVIVIVWIYSGLQAPSKPKSVGEVIINGLVLKVEIASTSQQQTLGLGKRESLAGDSGMLFTYPDYGTRRFWMKDMKFPIDILWIKDNTIIGIDANVPAPLEGQQSLPVYTSPQEVNYVLEVNAGWAEENKVQIGDKVTLKLE